MDLSDSEYDRWQDEINDLICGDCRHSDDCGDCPGQELVSFLEAEVFGLITEAGNLLTHLTYDPSDPSNMTQEEKFKMMERYFTQREMVKCLLTSKSEGDSGDRARDLAKHFVEGLDLDENEDLESVQEAVASIFEAIAEEARVG